MSNRYFAGQDIKFDIAMRASRAGGIEAYNRKCGVPQYFEDPLDDAFDPNHFAADVAPAKPRKRREDMTAEEFRDARGRLGQMWGLDRPLTLTEFGRVLRLGGVRPDQSVRDYERGKTAVSGPLSVLIEMMLAGAKPPGLDAILSRAG
jgi:hypothetical protein